MLEDAFSPWARRGFSSIVQILSRAKQFWMPVSFPPVWVVVKIGSSVMFCCPLWKLSRVMWGVGSWSSQNSIPLDTPYCSGDSFDESKNPVCKALFPIKDHFSWKQLTQLTNLQKAAGRLCGNCFSPAMPFLAGTLWFMIRLRFPDLTGSGLYRWTI